MGEQIAILSPGVWELRELVEKLTGFEPVWWAPPLKRPKFGCVVGWGLKPTSNDARQLARKSDKAYIAMEDGFIRSIKPGAEEIPVSLVTDKSGVYYDARGGSDLEDIIVRNAHDMDAGKLQRARRGMRLLRSQKISKYNHAPVLSAAEIGLGGGDPADRVLVVDQTFGDSSVSYGLADATSFRRMLQAACDENPRAQIIVKTHPEVVSGRKKGYLTEIAQERVKLVAHDVNPWSLIELVDKVYVVTSQLGFEALLAGRKVVCFGAPFYAGWGLTDDRMTIFRRRRARPSVEQLFAAVYFDYARYICPEHKVETSFEEAVAWLIGKRDNGLTAARIR